MYVLRALVHSRRKAVNLYEIKNMGWQNHSYGCKFWPNGAEFPIKVVQRFWNNGTSFTYERCAFFILCFFIL